jgi:ribonuclease HI
MRNFKIYCDGGARGNPGPAASAFIVEKDNKIIYEQSRYLGKTTNNVAEYTAVLMALRWIDKNIEREIFTTINFFLDSELVVKQLKGLYKIKSNNLKPLIYSIKVLENKIPANIFYTYISRNKNRKSDFLVNKNLDENLNKISRPRKFFKKNNPST